jgi:hypothetical protein
MRSLLPLIALGVALAFTCASPRFAHAETAAHEAGRGHLLTRQGLDEDSLERQRGGADTHLSEIRAVGSVSEVQAYDLVTGHNIVSDGALANTSGMPMLIQNSGNGVLIQNAVILNVEVR